MGLAVAFFAVLITVSSFCSNSSQFVNGESMSVTWIMCHEADPSLLMLMLYSMCSESAKAVAGITSAVMRTEKINARFMLFKRCFFFVFKSLLMLQASFCVVFGELSS